MVGNDIGVSDSPVLMGEVHGGAPSELVLVDVTGRSRSNFSDSNTVTTGCTGTVFDFARAAILREIKCWYLFLLRLLLQGVLCLGRFTVAMVTDIGFGLTEGGGVLGTETLPVPTGLDFPAKRAA
jgi:hypothetical protein